jgi:hypothetical protein
MVLYYLESHDLKQLETEDTTLRRQKNSQDSVIVSNPDAIPPDLKRYELKLAGDIWMKVFLALPEELAAALQAAVSGAEPMNQAIKQCFASGRTIDGGSIFIPSRNYTRREMRRSKAFGCAPGTR